METRIVVAIDTEGSPEVPWGLQYSTAPGSGVVITATDSESLAKFIAWVQQEKPLLVTHNLIHDAQVLGAFGVPMEFVTDTMLMATLLGTEPLGLKSLARRHCAMVMQDYSDVIAPAKREKAIEYLAKVLDYAETIVETESHAAAE